MDSQTIFSGGTFAAVCLFTFGTKESSKLWAQGALLSTVFMIAINEAHRLKKSLARATALTTTINNEEFPTKIWKVAKQHGMTALDEIFDRFCIWLEHFSEDTYNMQDDNTETQINVQEI